MAEITLDIKIQQDIGIEISSEEEISISVESEKEIDLDFGFDGTYTGSYEPIPSVQEQTLETANKRMLGDVKVQPIPVSRVSAPDNKGYVVTIG